VTTATPVEDRDPSTGAVVTQVNAEALVRHADDHEPDAGPGVEPLVDESQLGRRKTARRRAAMTHADAAAPLYLEYDEGYYSAGTTRTEAGARTLTTFVFPPRDALLRYQARYRPA
jgi:hypothetical protein